ncbi:aerobic respiration control sensor protein ArcB [Clostridiales bacterium]|nr:aerobic respiration control sensor protein ArcB [Clostridiales bacterium]
MVLAMVPATAFAATAAITDVTIDGKVGTALEKKSIVVTLTDDTTTAAATTVDHYTLNTPAGISIDTVDATDGDTEITINLTGTPTAVSEDTITLTIAAEALTGATELEVTENTNAKWAIAKADGPVAPTGLVGVAPTTEDGSDGKITGTDATMEYKADSDFVAEETGTACTATETTGLAAGTYYVRVAATATTEAGASVEVEVPAFSAGAAAVAAPTFTPVAGEVESGTTVAIACATDGATIYYTTETAENLTDDAFKAAPATDGTVYTDKYITYMPDEGTLNLMPYFSGGNEHVVARFDDKIQGSRITNESILYGIRLKDYSVDGIKMYALIGISDVSTMQDNIVIDSFIKNGKSRGHSSLIDLNGNYIVNVNKDIHLNWQRNLFDHLSESADSELTNEEVFRKLHNSETFAFYHTHVGEKNKELFYFIPFNKDIDLYFIMSVNEEVFMEQSHTFVTMSMATLIISMIAVVIMLLVVMKFQVQAARTSAKARAQKEFLSNMSHEIRTPLNGLIGMNHLIMVNIDDDQQKSQIKEWLKKSHSTASYLLSLVNDILDMSKLQAGKVDIINEPLMVDVLVEEIVTMQAENIRSRGVDFIVEKDITEPCILGDATRIKQILMNIVGNAAKFTPKGNYIKLSVSQKKIDAQHVITTYCCEDTGIGISKEYIGKIFDSFTQERNRFENNVKGTGLGMAISKLLANAMNGDIAVESEINVGSTFTVTLPSEIVYDIPDYLLETNSRFGDDTSIPLLKENGKPIKILVVEDVELNAEILLEILDMEGFETAHAQNGKEAIEIFEQSEIGEFDIILMDMQMPIMDG